MDLHQKKAIVTGVSRGIGLEICNALLKKGAIVAGWGRRAPELDHPRFSFFEADVADFESMRRAHAAASRALGPEFHILVNNAGVGYSGSLEQLGRSFLSSHPLEPSDVAQAVLFVLESGENCLPAEVEVRPLRPGRSSGRVNKIMQRIRSAVQGNQDG
jgi:NAD(P)-dependent dehydrogenase (short-subunit alcohol dehydrogenase family)